MIMIMECSKMSQTEYDLKAIMHCNIRAMLFDHLLRITKTLGPLLYITMYLVYAIKIYIWHD